MNTHLNANQIIAFNLAKKTSMIVSHDEMMTAMQDPHLIFWIHHNSNDNAQLDTLRKQLNLDESIFEFINENKYIPMISDTEDSLTIKIQTPLDLSPLKKRSEHYCSLVIHLTARFCLTVSSHPVPALQEFQLHYERSLRYAETPCFILFLIFDNVLSNYADILFIFETSADELDYTVRASDKNHYHKVMVIKKQIMQCKRYVSGIRDILMRISGRKILVVSEKCRKSLSDLYNHSQIIVSETDSIRELLNGLLDQIDNLLIYRMSETMKVLTAFAAIFLPLTLITGIYGMNFKSIPELEWEYGYLYALGLLVICGLSLFAYFKYKKWF